MPLLNLGDSICYFRLDGRDGQPVVMLSHSLGQDHGMWDAQAAALAAHFRVLRYDIRGHGASAVTPGEYRIEQLGRDALALADALGIERFAFCGLSLGGMIGLWLAIHAPARLTAAALANTSPRPGAERMAARRRVYLRVEWRQWPTRSWGGSFPRGSSRRGRQPFKRHDAPSWRPIRWGTRAAVPRLAIST